MKNHTKIFQDALVPESCQLAGYSALVYNFDLKVPVRNPACISEKHILGSKVKADSWTIYDKRYLPGNTECDHLGFAIKHENLDLLILKRIFEGINAIELANFLKKTPSGIVHRKIWFLYEILTDNKLDLPDAGSVKAIPLLDEKLYFTGNAVLSKRHRIRNNLLGTPRFCPTIRRTQKLMIMLEDDLSKKANTLIGKTGASIIARATSFLLLADSKASFAIEGERPARNRIERWARAIGQSGKTELSIEELIRLHSILIEDNRFVDSALRIDGVFLGERERNGDPLPEFIGAKPSDLKELLDGLMEASKQMSEFQLNPILHAAVIAFGFVYIHPFSDGNGRLHRCLIHHVLTRRLFNPLGMVFPVSSVMLEKIDDYRKTLQDHSGSLMPFIDWQVTESKNVEVLNDTRDFYRYPDLTENCEFLYDCVKQTVEHNLPEEIRFIQNNDKARERIMNIVEMPDRLVDQLILFVRQNDGHLPKKRRTKEFAKLSDHEVLLIEDLIRDCFED